MVRTILHAFIAAAALLAGCATPPASTSVATDYACAGGGAFRRITTGEVTTLEFDGMRFVLRPDSTATTGEAHVCDMLRLTVHGGTAQLDLEGKPFLVDCSRTP